jgi:metalloendopeptidase OMA1, mitochondrial
MLLSFRGMYRQTFASDEADNDSNKVFVYTGILPVCGDDDGVATVLSHEIAHTVCHHAAESASYSAVYYALLTASIVAFAGIDLFSLFGLSLVFTNPKSRRMESEADKVGLKLSE